eukprot:GHVU01103724.1.p1 GENE.GHVU01103724.1~~GHVU01103724.1.p1  ORF type:complete len:144 (+),score=5.96 GHVU01103724.1:503-934(+)
MPDSQFLLHETPGIYFDSSSTLPSSWSGRAALREPRGLPQPQAGTEIVLLLAALAASLPNIYAPIGAGFHNKVFRLGGKRRLAPIQRGDAMARENPANLGKRNLGTTGKHEPGSSQPIYLYDQTASKLPSKTARQPNSYLDPR